MVLVVVVVVASLSSKHAISFDHYDKNCDKHSSRTAKITCHASDWVVEFAERAMEWYKSHSAEWLY